MKRKKTFRSYILNRYLRHTVRITTFQRALQQGEVEGEQEDPPSPGGEGCSGARELCQGHLGCCHP